MQIQPETFKQYAAPGESIDNPADNQAVGKRIIDDLSAKSGGDPARIAVGYFSGLATSRLPEARRLGRSGQGRPDRQDGFVYVSDVLGRVNGSSLRRPRLPTLSGRFTGISKLVRPRRGCVDGLDAAENQFTRQIVDASAGIGPLPSRSEIEANQFLGESTRNSLLAKYDSAASDVIKLQSAMKKFTDPNGGDFNPFDTDEKKNVDRIFNSLGGDMKALEIVTNRTGMVPEGAVTALRGA
jgi:hypothetical protein